MQMVARQYLVWELKRSAELLRTEHGMPYPEIQALVGGEEAIPVSAYNSRLSGLETIVKYLAERGHSLKGISDMLNRDYRTIWDACRAGRMKHPGRLRVSGESALIPVSVFRKRKLSVMEAAVSYLKVKLGWTLHRIAAAMKRDDSTIWTVYRRARAK
ncbi:MAG: hypothetical protein ABH879_06310 [archaeon]